MLEKGRDYRIEYSNIAYDVRFFSLTSFANLHFFYVYSYKFRVYMMLPAIPNIVILEITELKYDSTIVGDLDNSDKPQNGLFNECNTVQDILGDRVPIENEDVVLDD